MALDAGMVSAITAELSDRLTNSKIEKIYQPEKDQIVFIVRAGGEICKLCASASSNNPRVNITTLPKENPAVPPMFCTLLRKHLAGGKIVSVKQYGFERAIEIGFDAKDEMGFAIRRYLICELLGKFSNLIFTDENYRILGVVKPVDFTTSTKRQVLPGMTYEMPPLQDKADPTQTDKDSFYALYDQSSLDVRADKWITNSFLGISSLVAREIVKRAGGESDALLSDLNRTVFCGCFLDVFSDIQNKNFQPCLVKKEGKCFEFCFMPITQYGAGCEVLQYASVSELLDVFYATRENEERLHTRAQDLLHLVTGAIARIDRKMQAQNKELAECDEKERYKQYGDLITANLYALKRGDTEVCLVNYYDESMPEVTLTLDSRLTPAANAQRYYKKYAKLKNAEEELTKQLILAEDERKYLESVWDLLNRATGQSDLADIREELSLAGYASRMRKQEIGGKKKTATKPIRYRTSSGYTVYVGRNNLQNDELSFKRAEKEDYWFHVHAAPGSHAILCCAGQPEPPAEDFTEAAMIAAYHSSLADGAMVTVDYTKARHLKRAPGAKPGFVIYHTNYSANVIPDKEKVSKLLD